MLAWLEMYKLPYLASFYAARKAIIGAEGTLYKGTLGCDVMKGGGAGGSKLNVTSQ